MIQDVFKFKKGAWHLKLMHLIWGFNHHDFPNMCPYFWLSVFNVFLGWWTVLPVKLLFKGLFKLADYLQDLRNDYEQRCKQEEEKRALVLAEQARLMVSDLKRVDNSKIEDWYLQQFRGHKKRVSSGESWIIRNEVMYMPGFDDIFAYLDKKWNEIEAKKTELKQEKIKRNILKENEAREARLKRIQLINSIATKTKFAVNILAYVVGGAIGFFAFWLYTIVYCFLADVNWWSVLEIIGQIALSVLFIALVLLAVILIRFLWCRFGKYCVPCEERRELLAKCATSIVALIAYPFVNFFPLIWQNAKDVHAGPLTYLVLLIFKPIKLGWELLVAMKQENCPGIEWED